MPPVSEVSIRCSTPCDVTMLREILHDTYRNTWLPELSAEAAQMFRNEDRPAIYVEKRGAEFWVAELEGKVVGFVDWEGDFVNALHVRTEKARTGIGRHLMDFAEAEIAKNGFSSARLETDTFNARSRAFYAARGYRETEQYPDTEWNSGLTTILLVKSLG